MSWLSNLPRPRTLHSIFVAVIVISLATGGTALAVRGAWWSDPLFQVCIGNTSGALRMLAEGDTCKSSETPIVLPSQGYVDAETANRQAADNALSARIDGLGSIDAEAAARKQGDADTLAAAKAYTDTSVANEAAARSAGDASLQTAVNGLQTSLNNEVAARKQGDADTLAAAKAYTDAALAGDKAYTDTSVAAEGAARTAADSSLQTSLNNEVAARKQGDADTLGAAKSYTDASVANEAAARQAADTSLQSSVNGLQTSLNNETAARQSGDAATLAAANAYTDAHSGSASFTAGTGITITGTTISADFAPFDARYYTRTSALGLQILSTRVSNSTDLAAGGTLTGSISCPTGKVLIGGGASSSNPNLVLYQSFPASTLQWTASGRAEALIPAFGVGLQVYVICAAL